MRVDFRAIDREWSLTRLADANELLDAMADAREKQAKEAERKARR